MSALLILSGTAMAQLLPQVGGAVGRTGAGVDRIGEDLNDRLSDSVRGVDETVRRLARTRVAALDALVRQNPDALEFDAHGDPAVKGELLVIEASPTDLQAAAAAGFSVAEQGGIDGIDVAVTRLSAPRGMSLAKAEKLFAKVAPSAAVQSNPIYNQSGAAGRPDSPASAMPPTNGPGAAIGMIDGGVASHPALPGPVVQRGFAQGAPAPGNHATAIASILVGQGAVRGVSPRSRLYAADVFGKDPRGGNALAIVRALGWLTASGVRVVNISLAGPANPLLARAVAAADRRGVLMIAAVGNDGAAAPAAYPASYPQVIAVTGVDRRNKALIEAGKAAHLDFAAPGADLAAATAAGGVARVRGTSFAAPFVAGRLARLAASGPLPRARAISLLSAEARPAKGGRVGRGIICDSCSTH